MLLKHNRLAIIFLTLSIAACNDSGDSSDSSSSENSTGFTLSGHILVANNTATDNDVNDRQPLVTNNNYRETAQKLPNPVILGGYVNQPYQGPSGYFQRTGDINDYYEVDLRAGQIIYLFVASEDLGRNDVDLFLLDSNGVVIDASIGEQDVEGFKVTAAGHYVIQVRAYRGASNYVLSIGQDITLTSNGMRLSDQFRPGEVIVQLSPDSHYQAQSIMNSFGLQTQSPDTSRRMLFHFDHNQSYQLAAPELKFASPELQAKYETLMLIKQLRQRADILEASPNYQWQSFAQPNDKLYPHQWNLKLMNLPPAWDITVGDSAVIVAILDSGALFNHPDLKGNLIAGYDFIQDLRLAQDDDGIDPNPADPGDGLPGGSSFHGTHVAGTIAAVTNNNQGIAGIGWLTKVMPLRVLGKNGFGSDYDIEQAVRFAAGLPNDSGTVPPQPADIINLSLGGPDVSLGFQQVMTQARQAGIIVVAAAGNENTDLPSYPAALDGVISVGAIDINKQRASYSNFGDYLDVVAPGGDQTPDVDGDGMPDGILSTVGHESTATNSPQIRFTFDVAMGTSMASPHVAGVIALMKAVNPNLIPSEFDNLLRSGKITDDLGSPGRDNQFGYGLLNAQKAVLAAIELNGGVAPEPPPPFLVVNPTSLNFGLDQSQLILTLDNSGSGELQVENIFADSEGMLTIEGSGLGAYVVKLNRANLATGTFSATITVATNANIVKIPVIWQVGDPNAAGNAGLHYVLLIDPQTSATIQEITTSATQGIYSYQFDQVPQGTYIIIAGTDFNNDGLICDIGEACGAFFTASRPTSLEVNTNRSEINFNTGFNVNFFSSQLTSTPKTALPIGFSRLRHTHQSILFSNPNPLK
jgi:serine protease